MRQADHEADEPALVARVCHGDVAAFDELMRRHTPAVVRYTARIAARRDDVEDVVQEVLLTAWRRRRDLDPDRSLLPWLLVTARFTALAANRSGARQAAVAWEDAPPLHEWERDADRREAIDELDALHEVIDGLGPIDQRIVQLCLVQGETYEAAAERLGLSPPATRKRVQRIRARFHAFRGTRTDATFEN